MSTVTVGYDLSPAMVEGEIRKKLIEMGWTPPASDREQVGLTDDEIDNAAVASRLICSKGQTYHVEHADIRPFIRSTVRRCIAAHEAKKGASK